MLCLSFIFLVSNQTMRVRWGAEVFRSFNVTNGVRRSSVLSPLLFSVYIDQLSYSLNQIATGCCVGDDCLNHLTEVESRTQGSSPRPRTQKNFAAKAMDRLSRGQGQGLRTQTQVFSKRKKKVFKNFFRQNRSSKNFFQAIST